MAQQVQHGSMATVCKISRNYMVSPQFKSLQEWFCYAFKSSELDQVDRFPVLGSQDVNRRPSHPDRGVFNQTTEIIFALPCLRSDLKTDHIQLERPPASDSQEERPKVVCSFVTEFEDHIFVTVDAEAFFFLHDLITSYVKEKDKVVPGGQTSSHSPAGATASPLAESPEGAVGGRAAGASGRGAGAGAAAAGGDRLGVGAAAAQQGTQPSTSDWRSFECKTWHLEPTVRLQSWAGRKIEPYGVDYILQRLGFSHAKTTIPKWMQRGFLDPLDKILSVIVHQAVLIVSDESDSDDVRRRKISSMVTKSDSFGESNRKTTGGSTR